MITWLYRHDLMRSHAFDGDAQVSVCGRTSRKRTEIERAGFESRRCMFCQLLLEEREGARCEADT